MNFSTKNCKQIVNFYFPQNSYFVYKLQLYLLTILWYNLLVKKKQIKTKTSEVNQMENQKLVIYKAGGIYFVTPESNFNAVVQDARLKQKMIDFSSTDEVIDYFVKYCKCTKSQFIIHESCS